MRCLATLGVSLLLTVPSFCMTWEDPTFEVMVAEAELIAVVEVVEGGPYVCTVRAEEVVKGTNPGAPFAMGGYNDPNWPAYGIEKETLKKGERLLAFLRHDQVLDFAARDDEKAKEIEGWAVPTPTTGDFRIADGLLRGSWYDPSYPHAEPGVDVGLVLVLVKGYVLHSEGKPPVDARKRIAAGLTRELVRSVHAPQAPEQEGEASNSKERAENAANAALIARLACAQGAYGEKELTPILLEAAGHPHYFVKVYAARALRTAGASTEVLEALGRLLLAPESPVQAEAARTLALGGFGAQDAVPLLLKALPTSSGEGDGPSGIMDPLPNRGASGREVMVRTLTRLQASREAHDALVNLIREEGLTEGVLGALSHHFLAHPSEVARNKLIELYSRCPDEAVGLFHKYLFREKSTAAANAVGEKAVKLGPKSWETATMLRWLALVLPPRDGRLHAWVRTIALACRREAADGESAKNLDVIPFAVLAPEEEVAKALAGWPTSGWSKDDLARLDLVREAVSFELSPSADAKARVDRWIELAGRWDADGNPWLTGFIFRELVAATPEELRKYAVGKLCGQGSESSFEVLRALRMFGATLTEEEKKEIEEGERALRSGLGE